MVHYEHSSSCHLKVLCRPSCFTVIHLKTYYNCPLTSAITGQPVHSIADDQSLLAEFRLAPSYLGGHRQQHDSRTLHQVSILQKIRTRALTLGHDGD